MISNFWHVLNVVCFLLGNSPASHFRRRGITQKKVYNNKYIHIFHRETSWKTPARKWNCCGNIRIRSIVERKVIRKD